MALIELKDVSKLYGFGDATTLALDEVSVSIEKANLLPSWAPVAAASPHERYGPLGPAHQRHLHAQRQAVDRLRPTRAAKLRRDTLGFIFQNFNLCPNNRYRKRGPAAQLPNMSTTRRLKTASSMLERVGMQSREYFRPASLVAAESSAPQLRGRWLTIHRLFWRMSLPVILTALAAGSLWSC